MIKKNFIVSIISQVIIMCLGFIIPRIILTNYGSDTNGVISTISQIFSYMALLEAGISQAARNVLYKPIAQNDHEGISYYMSVARGYYRRIAKIYLLLVIVIGAVMPLVLNSNLGFWTIFLYTLFDGLVNVVSFYYTNTYICFLNTTGKTYVNQYISLVNTILCYTVRIGISLLGVSIVYIEVGYFAISLIKLTIYHIYMKKKYSWIDYSFAPKNAKLRDRNSYVITEIAGTVFSSTDMIVLSIFASTSLSSVYSVYNMVFLAMANFLNAIYQGINYKLGQSYIKGREYYKAVHDVYNSFFMSCITILMCVGYILILPFVSIYTAGVKDINYIYRELPLLFCLVQILSWSRFVSGNLSGIAGYAKQTSYVSLIEALTNIVLSVTFVNIWGIVGVLLATVVALPVKVIYLNWLADKKIMQRSPSQTIKILSINYVIFAATVIINNLVQIEILTYYQFIFYGIILVLIYSVIVFGLNVLVNHSFLNTIKLIVIKKQ